MGNEPGKPDVFNPVEEDDESAEAYDFDKAEGRAALLEAFYATEVTEDLVEFLQEVRKLDDIPLSKAELLEAANSKRESVGSAVWTTEVEAEFCKLLERLN